MSCGSFCGIAEGKAISTQLRTEGRSRAGPIIGFTLLLSVGYAVVRYHIAGPVPWSDFPLFILNKGLSLAGFILLAFNFSLGPLKNLGIPVPDRWLGARKVLGMTAFLLVLLHVFMSFLLFSPDIYSKFFDSDGSLSLVGGWSMLFGLLGFVFLWAYNISFQTFLRENTAFIQFLTSRKTLMVVLTLGGLHLLIMGYGGWLKPEAWHGGLPPISLVAFAFFAIGYLANMLGRK